MVSVRFKVNAAVNDIHGVGVAGNGDGKAPALGRIDPAGAGTQVKLILVDVTGLQIDD